MEKCLNCEGTIASDKKNPKRIRKFCSQQCASNYNGLKARKGKLCSVDGCFEPHRAKGLCSRHYARAKINGGDPGEPERRKTGRPKSFCAIEGCDEQCVGQGLCSLHWQRKKNGTAMVGEKFSSSIKCITRDEDGFYLCLSCNEYYESKDGKHTTKCNRCAALWRRHKLTWQDFCKMLEKQNGCCAICEEEFGDRKIVVDHDHRCCPGDKSCRECVRGLLHHSCNTAIGKLKEDPIIFKRAIEYIERGGFH